MAGAVPFLTAKHAHHSAVWTIKGFSIDQICVACSVEHIEDGQALGIQVKRVLGELLALLRSGDKSLYQVISADKRVQEHLLNIIFARVKGGDEGSLTALCIDALIAFVEFLNTSEPPRKLLQQTVHMIMTTCNFLSSLPHVALLGRLLHSQPALCTELAHTYRGFLDYLLSGMTYSDEAVKSGVAYVLVQLFSRSDQNSLPPGFVQATCRHLSVSLASAKSTDLTANLMGLVNNLVKCDRHAQYLLQADQLDSETKGSTFAMAFKRVLLNTDEFLQLAAVQCLQDVLTHHSHYCEVLLKADIAEFLCEAIKTKNESLLSSLFICLNALANADSFYSDCHVIYVIDPVIAGINTALWLRNQEVALLGFTLLSQVLSRQLKAVLLFVTAEPFAKLLNVMTEAVQQKSLPLSTRIATVLSFLLKSQHVPVNASLSPVLPLLAQLFQCVDPLSKLTSVQQVLSQPTKLLLTEVLSAADSMYQLSLRCLVEKKEKVFIPEETLDFLNSSFEEVLLPAVLLNYSHLDEPEPLTFTFSIAKSQCLACDCLTQHTRRLALSGFIQLSFDTKNKYHYHKRVNSLITAVDEFLVELCAGLVTSKSYSSYVRDILHPALPHIPSSIVNCMELLNQRATTFLGNGSSSLRDVQGAILLLLHNAFTHDDRLVSWDVLVKALEGYVSLNPDIHLLPPIIFTCLLVLYSLADSGNEGAEPMSLSSHARQLNSSRDLIARGLLRITSIGSVFVPSGCVLRWLFKTPSLVSCVGKSWLVEWLKDPTRQAEELLGALNNSLPMLESLLGLLALPEPLVNCATVVNILAALVTKEGPVGGVSSSQNMVLSTLERMLLIQRAEGLHGISTVGIFKTLTAAVTACSQPIVEAKLVHHVANIIARSDTEQSFDIAISGMDFLSALLSKHTDASIQVSIVLLNNIPFMQKVTAFIPFRIVHTVLSASSMQLLAEIIDCHCLSHYSDSPSSLSQAKTAKVRAEPLLAALWSQEPAMKLAALQLWRVVFTCQGQLGCFAIEFPANWSEHQSTLLFLILNALVGQSTLERESAALCFVHFLSFIKASNQWKDIQHNQWTAFFLRFLGDIFHDVLLPQCYLLCLAKILQDFRDLKTTVELRSTSQLLYAGFVTHRCNLTEQQQEAYEDCFEAIGNIDKDLYSVDEWSHINKHCTDKERTK